MSKPTREQIEAFRDAMAIVDGMPEDRFVPRLGTWRIESDCGTLYCAGGALVAAGVVEASAIGYRYNPDYDDFCYKFGFDPSELFVSKGYSLYDDSAPPGISDKLLVRHRVCCILREWGEPINPEYEAPLIAAREGAK